MEDLADLDTAPTQLSTCSVEVIDDEERALDRSWYRGREPLADHDGAR